MKRFSITLLSVCAVFAVNGCGGSGGKSFTAVGTSTSPAPSKIGNRPIAIKIAEGANIFAVSPNGQMVGNNAATTLGYYWSSPTASPQTLPVGPYSVVEVTGINNSGQMVGFGNVTGGDTVPLIWANATSSPQAMATPDEQDFVLAVSINASGQIVGFTGIGTAARALYWASPTSNPVTLAGVGGANTTSDGIYISDNGQIYGASGVASNVPIYWPSPSANAQNLPTPAGAVMQQVDQLYFGMDQETGEACANLSSDNGTTYIPTVWPLPGLSNTTLPSPSGQSESSFVLSLGNNHVAIGAVAQTSTYVAAEWKGYSSTFTDLNTLLPSGTGWQLEIARFTDDAGDIIGEGKTSSNQYAFFVVNFS